ncbi:MAG: hypothetical protein ACXWNX_05670 [Isosphaeraceae bacterium]
MTHSPSHRQFLETAAAGMALGMGMMTVSGGAAVAATAAQPGRRPRVTALTSVYFYLSHASHIVGRFLDGFVVYPEDTAATTFFGEPHKPSFEIASRYIEQTPEATDLGRAKARKHGGDRVPRSPMRSPWAAASSWWTLCR